ncbi:hypothetical protein [endosymbiont DhMRE of Dentiscutata heterogama]|uniref:hypothetical protein n=1 Tax=endosymbiont DhMRE of Dentiscutata heterogama TaxID=1609546 RepID=UPI002AD5908D|nr:hypothetical protein [endosymbiont DhMRE of Dentiscutata heterogama]
MHSLLTFIFNSQEETLVIKYPNGKTEQKSPDWRDKWDNAGFNLEPLINKNHWIQFGKWKRKKGTSEVYECIRLFYKRVEGGNITYYMQEKKLQAVLTFTISEKDRVEKISKGKWIYTNNDGAGTKRKHQK